MENYWASFGNGIVDGTSCNQSDSNGVHVDICFRYYLYVWLENGEGKRVYFGEWEKDHEVVFRILISILVRRNWINIWFEMQRKIR